MRLFEPLSLGPLHVQNRLARSATYEAMAPETGEVNDKLVRLYETLAKGQVGLIIAGYSFVQEAGKCMKYQTGLHDDALVPGWKKLVDAVHAAGGTISAQIVHGGLQSVKQPAVKHAPAPSGGIRNLSTFVTSRAMDGGEIQGVIEAFGKAASRAVSAGFDAIQVHAAHGYLASQFLSPFFNRREDEYGGSDEKRFKFLREVIEAVKKVIPNDKAVLVKLNTDDRVRGNGITPVLAKQYASWLAALHVDCVEVSCGTVSLSPFDMSRGTVPINGFARMFPKWQRPLVKPLMRMMFRDKDLTGEYNLDAARAIKPALGSIPLMLVGGVRSVARMEEILQAGSVDMVSMSRPFIREPMLAKGMKEGRISTVACTSCNNCFAAAASGLPLACYVNGLPPE
ncbi:MAG: NADH:flavin oxidoreductase [Candidatus Lokiarchaeota archaeon]|nr:NADH:flavin oxidoreductase [Candidatus Lokiarchaeota archaeon]